MFLALRCHWPEYLMEAAELCAFMIAACVAADVLCNAQSPVAMAVPNSVLQRLLMGFAMGGTAVAIIYSPWGKQSGANFNPTVTLTFLRLGKIAPLGCGLLCCISVYWRPGGRPVFRGGVG
jgi:aquaporin Z